MAQEITDKLIEKLEEYNSFIGDELGKFAIAAATRGIFTSDETIKKGEKFREEIKALRDEYNKK